MLFQALKLMPGNNVAAVAAALFKARVLMNDRLVILICHSFSKDTVYGST